MQKSQSNLIGIVISIGLDGENKKHDYYRLTEEGMKKVGKCRQGLKIHASCANLKLYESIKHSVTESPDLPLKTHISSQFEDERSRPPKRKAVEEEDDEDYEDYEEYEEIPFFGACKGCGKEKEIMRHLPWSKKCQEKYPNYEREKARRAKESQQKKQKNTIDLHIM